MIFCLKGEKMKKYLEIKRITKTYYNPPGDNGQPVMMPTLDGISFTVDKGQFVSIIGPSGCGKSTLFNLISGLEKPDDGRILLEGRDITGKKGHVSYMLQKDLLLPWRSILDNCTLGLELQEIALREAREKARSLLAEFNLAGYTGSYPFLLSGGMRQRVAFARTMLSGKEVLLLDEPFGALDAYTKSEMHDWLAQVLQKHRSTVLFITHDVEEALLLSDRVCVLSARPAAVKLELVVDLPRPRSRDMLVSDKFIELKKNIMDVLFADKQSLAVN